MFRTSEAIRKTGSCHLEFPGQTFSIQTPGGKCWPGRPWVEASSIQELLPHTGSFPARSVFAVDTALTKNQSSDCHRRPSLGSCPSPRKLRIFKVSSNDGNIKS